ncbi:hypothetical protein [Lysobacter sp. CFH 32150]|uniref:hypothetical protein n=1 Tax=Lysobacter sp. CFH 32150 TaxID=2927128 RepID=UPI001FA6FDF6|nr:hypothetical protein [Lysobacter sp. CFH 32150]MCI4568951.1 hypothetical protein [Lysobacter sp. CFH 32150]
MYSDPCFPSLPNAISVSLAFSITRCNRTSRVLSASCAARSRRISSMSRSRDSIPVFSAITSSALRQNASDASPLLTTHWRIRGTERGGQEPSEAAEEAIDAWNNFVNYS